VLELRLWEKAPSFWKGGGKLLVGVSVPFRVENSVKKVSNGGVPKKTGSIKDWAKKSARRNGVNSLRNSHRNARKKREL
jgi:hypothetical protein